MWDLATQPPQSLFLPSSRKLRTLRLCVIFLSLSLKIQIRYILPNTLRPYKHQFHLPRL
jgi:hypothetical protein